jgi:hypothetical protein
MTSAATAPTAPSPARSRSRAALGRVRVGDYVGSAAAQAAQAVRRAGLRPGLERQFRCETELIGCVVAQDPPANEELARNAMVTLYVAAPEAPQTQARASSDGLPQSERPRAPERVEPEPVPAVDVNRRHKKRRCSTTREPPHDPPPTPSPRPRSSPVAQQSVTYTTPHQSEIDPTTEELATADPPAPENGHRALGLPAELEDLFAAGPEAVPPWRRSYPRRPARARVWHALTYAARHPFATAMLAVLAVVWLTVALIGTEAHRSGRTAAPIASVAAAPRQPSAHGRATPEQVRHTGRALIPRRPRRPTRTHRIRRPRPAPARVASTGIAPAPAVASSAPPNRVVIPVQEQTHGGPFSP